MNFILKYFNKCNDCINRGLYDNCGIVLNLKSIIVLRCKSHCNKKKWIRIQEQIKKGNCKIIGKTK